MTVQSLIHALEQLDPDLPVVCTQEYGYRDLPEPEVRTLAATTEGADPLYLGDWVEPAEAQGVTISGEPMFCKVTRNRAPRRCVVI